MSVDSGPRAAVVGVLLTVLALVGCDAGDGGTTATVVDETAYVATMTDVCAETELRLGELPAPPDQITEADWATEVSRLLRDEAAAADRVVPPEERRDDHRALVRNTEEQSAAWRAIADTLRGEPTASELDVLTVEVGELTLGRDELVTEMGLDGCRRDR